MGARGVTEITCSALPAMPGRSLPAAARTSLRAPRSLPSRRPHESRPAAVRYPSPDGLWSPKSRGQLVPNSGLLTCFRVQAIVAAFVLPNAEKAARQAPRGKPTRVKVSEFTQCNYRSSAIGHILRRAHGVCCRGASPRCRTPGRATVEDGGHRVALLEALADERERERRT
jgi:hypothetical protein